MEFSRDGFFTFCGDHLVDKSVMAWKVGNWKRSHDRYFYFKKAALLARIRLAIITRNDIRLSPWLCQHLFQRKKSDNSAMKAMTPKATWYDCAGDSGHCMGTSPTDSSILVGQKRQRGEKNLNMSLFKRFCKRPQSRTVWCHPWEPNYLGPGDSYCPN